MAETERLITKAKTEVDETTTRVYGAFKGLLNRGESLEGLENEAERLASQSQVFLRQDQQIPNSQEIEEDIELPRNFCCCFCC